VRSAAGAGPRPIVACSHGGSSGVKEDDVGELNETQRYFIEEHVEDFRDGQITRRELFRRVTLIAGSAALATTILAACDLSPKSAIATATAGTSAGGGATPTARVTATAGLVAAGPYATPPAVVQRRAREALRGRQALRPQGGDRLPEDPDERVDRDRRLLLRWRRDLERAHRRVGCEGRRAVLRPAALELPGTIKDQGRRL